MDKRKDSTEKKQQARKPKVPRKITPERLANIALHYLERYASSAANLKRVLERRVYTSVRHHGEPDQDTSQQWIDALIARYQDAGLLNDLSYSEARARSLMARGTAVRMIRMKLLEKGIDTDTIDKALEALKNEAPDPELHAAIKLAKRRRLGPFADPDKREANTEKHLAAMARSGFSYDMARRIIECDDKDELEEFLNPPLGH